MDCYSPWGCKESDTTERLSLSLKQKRQRTEASGLYLQPLALCPRGLLAYCSYLSLSLQTEPWEEAKIALAFLHSLGLSSSQFVLNT